MKAREWGTDCSPYDRKERCLPPLLTVLCNSEFPLVQHSSLSRPLTWGSATLLAAGEPEDFNLMLGPQRTLFLKINEKHLYSSSLRLCGIDTACTRPPASPSCGGLSCSKKEMRPQAQWPTAEVGGAWLEEGRAEAKRGTTRLGSH